MIEYHKTWAAEAYTSPEICWVENDPLLGTYDVLCEEIPEGVVIIEHK